MLATLARSKVAVTGPTERSLLPKRNKASLALRGRLAPASD
jgi:hypothetical protein